MRKSMILAAIAALAMVSSCQKETAPVQDSTPDMMTFTASIVDPTTKTTINTDASSANRGKVNWEVNDEINVYDGTNWSVYYVKSASDIAADGSANFTYKSGNIPSKSATRYYASYLGSYSQISEVAYQNYSATAGKLPMEGQSDSSDKTKLIFSVSSKGLLKLNLTAMSTETDKTISKIEITGTISQGTTEIYTLACDNESIASAKDFYIVLPEGNYTTMKFTNSTGNICFKTAKTAMAIKTNTVQPVTLTGLTFTAMLPGKFTVNADGKQVRFSRGNLYYSNTDSKYHLEAAQNKTYDTLGQTAYDATHVCHFFWSNTTDWQTSGKEPWAESYSYGVQGTADKFFCGQANPMTVDGQGGLYALTSDELVYLLSTRGTGDSKFKNNVFVGGVSGCLVIAPDGYTGTISSSYNAAAWSAAESAGLVCLPTAGRRIGSSISTGDDSGFYWLATPQNSFADQAWFLRFYSGQKTSPSPTFTNRYLGCSIRLVTDAN